MPAASARQSAPNRSPTASKPVAPFLGMIEAVTVEPHGQFAFDGAIARDHLAAVWTWMLRDLATDLIDRNAIDDSERSRAALEALMPDLIERAEKAVSEARAHSETGRRLVAQLGGDDVYDRLPVALNALRFRHGFRAAPDLAHKLNSAPDEAGVAVILQAIPHAEQPGGAFLMHAV